MKGTRKTSVASIRITENSKERIINKVSVEDYFNQMNKYITLALEPITELDINVGFVGKIVGGGTNGQAEALRRAIYGSLINKYPEYKEKLKKKVYSKCDTRQVERKKPGLKKARKASTFVKR